MITPATFDFPPIYQGDTFEDLQFTISGVDLTGARIKCYLQQPNLPEPSYKFDSDPEIDTLSVDSATEFTLKQFNIALQPGKYKHDLVIITADEIELTYWTGSFTVLSKTSR